MKFNRRTALKLGTASLAFGSLPWLRARVAHGQPTPVPKRIFFFHVSAAASEGYWEPEGSRFDFRLGPNMAALEPFKSDLVVFKNLDLLSAHIDPGPARGGHEGFSSGHVLTGGDRFPSAPDVSTRPSLDQILSEDLQRRGIRTRLNTMHVAWGWDDRGLNEPTRSAIAFSGAGQPVPRIQDPKEAYDTFFPSSEDDEVDPSAGRRKAVIFDLIRSESSELIKKLSGPEKAKVEQHLDARSELESRLAWTPTSAQPRPSWSQLAPNHRASLWEIRTNSRGLRRYVEDADLERLQEAWTLGPELWASAIHADVARFGTIQIPWIPDELYGFSPGDFGMPTSHELEHNNQRIRDRPEGPAAIAVFNRWREIHFEVFARLLESLSSRTETDGQSLLHHCAVLYCGVTPDGSHNGHDLPWVVAGQAGGSLRTGQFLELDRWTHPDFKDGRRDVGRGHNDLLLTLAQAVGTPLEVIGNPKACQGPIQEMLV